jgi:glycerol-3-phosphate dehydrogenase (NAD(P)+)
VGAPELRDGVVAVAEEDPLVEPAGALALFLLERAGARPRGLGELVEPVGDAEDGGRECVRRGRMVALPVERRRNSHSRVVADELGDPKRVVTLVGPSLAGEIAAGVPTAVVCASVSEESARRAADQFSAPLFKAYTSDDVAGVEVGAALKNVIAIAVGMCDGVAESFGVDALTNTKAFLFSRGLVEMARLALASGGRAETVLGLAGAGDLFVTCLGGRNARFGKLVGAGKDPEGALEEMRTTVEGYTNARAAQALADKHGLELPIVRSVVEVLFGGTSPREAIERLVTATVEEEFNP